jgi:hypothetical protein
MMTENTQVASDEWVSFPGGELEGKRPKAPCPSCREAAKRAVKSPSDLTASGRRGPICFQCYRAELERERALEAAAAVEADARFQFQLPFEPVNRLRLDSLKAERASARARATALPAGASIDRRRHAQIEARHALQRLVIGLKARGLARPEADRSVFVAVRAAEMQLPESWLPFVVSR